MRHQKFTLLKASASNTVYELVWNHTVRAAIIAEDLSSGTWTHIIERLLDLWDPWHQRGDETATFSVIKWTGGDAVAARKVKAERMAQGGLIGLTVKDADVYPSGTLV